MSSFVRKYIVLFSILAIASILLFVYFLARDTSPEWTTDTVSTGTVQNIISVSGIVDAVSNAELAFSVGGVVEHLAVTEGDVVTQGQVLASLIHNDLKAEYQDAQAEVLIAQANRDELVNGLRREEVDISKTTTAIAKENVARVQKEQDEKVQNAYHTLLSSSLTARPDKKDNEDTPPVITGTYTCAEGRYTLNTFSSSAKSGYSYRLSGLENGTYTAYTESPSPLGMCGLDIQFSENVHYGQSTWTIDIPNTTSATYVTNKNAYELARTQQENAVREAEQNLILVEQNSTLEKAPPRKEELARADAVVMQAQARLSAIGAQMQEHILMAPFSGIVTAVEPVTGEAVGTTPIITMVSDETYALTALIPEIDVTKIVIGQKAKVIFDARAEEELSATIIFISPLAKEVDGVSYFEAKFILDEKIPWLKSGLNADLDIITESYENVTRIPKRYLIENEGAYTVLVPQGETAISAPVTVIHTGNDGFVEIAGLPIGTTVIAP